MWIWSLFVFCDFYFVIYSGGGSSSLSLLDPPYDQSRQQIFSFRFDQESGRDKPLFRIEQGNRTFIIPDAKVDGVSAGNTSRRFRRRQQDSQDGCIPSG